MTKLVLLDDQQLRDHASGNGCDFIAAWKVEEVIYVGPLQIDQMQPGQVVASYAVPGASSSSSSREC